MAEPTSSPNNSVAKAADLAALKIDADSSGDSAGASYSRFADTYQSLNRVIHSLQREYFDLKQEFDRRTSELVDLNEKLLSISDSQVTFGETLTAIFQSVGLGILVVNSEGVVTHINESACRILGLKTSDAIGIPYESVNHATNRSSDNDQRKARVADRTITRPDGTTAVVSSAVTLLRSRTGEVSGVVEAIQDQTHIRRLEAELTRLKTLAAMGEMVAGIAHEVRNPLAAIGGFAALLERDLATDEKKRVLAGKIMQGVDSLNETVTSMLDYTRQVELLLTPVELRGFLQQTIDAFLHDESAPAWKIEILLEPPLRSAHEPKLALDQRLMRQVMHNLLRNAVEAMHEQGTITVHYERLSRSAAATYAEKVMLTEEENLIVISVLDHGPGIPDEIRERLFFPLATTKPRGTGLGLAMAAKFVQSHGGEIVAEENSPQGAIFRVLLPLRLQN